MELEVSSIPVEDIGTPLMVHVVASGRVDEDVVLGRLDARMNGGLRKQLAQERFEGKPDQRVWVTPQGLVAPERLLIMGCKPAHLEEPQGLRRLAAEAGAAAVARNLTEISLIWAGSGSGGTTGGSLWGQAVADGAAGGSYKFLKYRNISSENGPSARLNRLAVGLAEPERLSEQDLAELKTGLKCGLSISEAVGLAADLVNEPPEQLTPALFGEQAMEIAEKKGLECRVLTPAECEKAGMRMFLAVSRGSPNAPGFIHLTFRPNGDRKKGRVVLVGKGITFDSGGLNIKAPASMAGMKSDMAGGAAVLAAMTLFREFDIGWEVHGLIPCAENMPSGEAYKVGDVLKAKDGTWVEVTNTDAEGRLTMADALAYGKEVEPDIMVDMATLTGACMVALGKDTAGVMGTSQKRVEQWMQAARLAGESMWPLPLLESLEKDLKSQVADVKNAGSRWGGAITAGLFLKRFVGDVDWIHVDIAGPAFRDKPRPGHPAGGTGFGVRTLLSFLASVRP